MRITSVEAFTVDVPLSQPIRLGSLRYDSRDYLIVRVATDAGISGVGYGMARYAPVARVVERNLARCSSARMPCSPSISGSGWRTLTYRWGSRGSCCAR